MLSAINKRIEYMFDREHQVGHAYLMGCSDKAAIDNMVRHKVIPSLAEYFYDDWRKVALVLDDSNGEGGFLRREPLRAVDGFASEGEAHERYRWTVRDSFSLDAYRRFR